MIEDSDHQTSASSGGDPPPDRRHWERAYAAKSAREQSWYQSCPELSLQLIRRVAATGDRIIDVGGGASTLVDHLLAADYRSLTVLDLTAGGMAASQRRLGDASGRVDWVVDDIRTFAPPAQYDLWHDRAVFHFLTDPRDRLAYRRVLERAVAPGGHLIMATFGPEGPQRCSDLDVVRYAPGELAAELGEGVELLEAAEELHMTPRGTIQQFVYCLLRRRER